MTSVGRGRGWATAKNCETALRRPGLDLTAQNNPHYLTLMKKIESLSINSSIRVVEIVEIKSMIMIASDNTSLEAVVNFLHEQALMDRQFGIKLGMLISFKIILNVAKGEDNNLRRAILQALQTSYENKEELKAKSMLHYRNAMSLLGEVYHHLRLERGKTVPVLGLALLDYMKTMLQSASEDDIEVVVTQLSLNGQKMYVSHPVKLKQILTHIRTVLVNRNLSAQSRAMLLFAIDLSNQLYKPLSEDLHAFYLAQLGEETLRQIQRCPEMPDTAINTMCEVHELEIQAKKKLEMEALEKAGVQASEKAGVGEVVKPLNTENPMENEISPKSNQQNLSKTVNTPNTNPPHGAQTSLPRAIRGLGIRKNRNEGTGDRKQRGKRDKLTDEQVWNTRQNHSSRSWGHDDRLERDYEEDTAACLEPSDVGNPRSPE